jgi:predicted small secreted protein
MKTKPVLFTSLLILCLLAMTGCRNTAKGVGKDMENAGEKIQEKVD